jgi:hypothetical protein
LTQRSTVGCRTDENSRAHYIFLLPGRNEDNKKANKSLAAGLLCDRFKDFRAGG